VVWAEPERNDWITAAGRAALALGYVERPGPNDPGPFRLADERHLLSHAARAGLETEGLEEVPVRWRASSLDEWWKTTRDTSRMLSLLLDRLDEAEAAALRAGAEERMARYVATDGTIEVTGVARTLVARRPTEGRRPRFGDRDA
jgi:hypothetical protein